MHTCMHMNNQNKCKMEDTYAYGIPWRRHSPSYFNQNLSKTQCYIIKHFTLPTLLPPQCYWYIFNNSITSNTAPSPNIFLYRRESRRFYGCTLTLCSEFIEENLHYTKVFASTKERGGIEELSFLILEK